MNTPLPESRNPAFQRNPNLENLLGELQSDLYPAEHQLIDRYLNRPMKHPLIFIMGPLRSGTTLFMQWLANLGCIAYPSNLLARFFHAPIIGAKIQLLLTDPKYNFRNELSDFSSKVEYKSENGKTLGTLAPNEFWYFWRRFLPTHNKDAWTNTELRENMDVTTMLAELSGITETFDKPFAAKGMMFNYNIEFFDSIFSNILFIQVKRDPFENALSVIDARVRQLGSPIEWYSFKIPEYESLKDLEPIEQALGQVTYIDRAISQGMSQVEDSRKLIVHYEDFCRAPQKTFDELCAKLALQATYTGPSFFPRSRTANNAECDQLTQAKSRLSLY